MAMTGYAGNGEGVHLVFTPRDVHGFATSEVSARVPREAQRRASPLCNVVLTLRQRNVLPLGGVRGCSSRHWNAECR
jgi:hypothetical protein